MFSRKQNYEAGATDTGAVDDLSRKLAVDLRKHVRKLDAHEPLQRDWNEMIDSLHHVANIAGMEHRSLGPASENSTLWEGDDLTVRFLLEEGKLNLCLRMMNSFCKVRSLSESSLGTYVSATGVADAAALKQRMLIFEQDMGLLLRCALEHVEAVQTADLPLICEHCKQVLQQALAEGGGAEAFSPRMQEVMVMHYLGSVCKRMEAGLDDGEGKLMPHIAESGGEKGLVYLVVTVLSKYPSFAKEGKLSAALFLAFVFDSEEYSTHAAKYSTPEVKATLTSLKPMFADVVAEAAQKDPKQKKVLRPLTDVLARV